jgi:hypothetical protein
MKKRIRNILIESLILESPMFKAVAIEYDGAVYVGEHWMGHADLVTKVAEEIDDLEVILDCTDGFMTIDGKFVTREQARQMVGYGESGTLKRVGAITI